MYGVCQSQFRSIWSHSTEAILILSQLKSAFFLVLVILVYLFCLTRTCLNILYMICLISFALIFLCHIFWQFPCIFLPYINTMPQEQDYNEWVKATFLSLEVKMLTAQVFSSKPVYHFEIPLWTIPSSLTLNGHVRGFLWEMLTARVVSGFFSFKPVYNFETPREQ